MGLGDAEKSPLRIAGVGTVPKRCEMFLSRVA
jgi:hypothetical protein